MPIRDYSQTAASNTSISSINIGEGCPPSNINDAIRQALADIREVQANSTIASASTVNIGAANAEYLAVSGTTTITAFDSVAAGVYRVLKFDGALTLTHNATSLILPGGASITTAANDVGGFRSLGSGNWRCEWYSKASGLPTSTTFPTVDINGGTIDGAIIGGASAAAGTFTTATVGAGLVGTPSLTTTGDTNTGLYFPAADTIAVTTGGTERMRIDNAGNVGIGTTSPTTLLNVSNANGSHKLDITAGAYSYIESNGPAGSELRGFVGGVQYSNIRTRSDSMLINNIGNTATIFNTNNTERMRIDSSGNVGIGTTGPVGRLDVRGSNSATFALFAGTTKGVRFNIDSNVANLEGVDNTGVSSYQPLGLGGSVLQFSTGATERMRIDSSGNVGIGTSSPGSPLQVVGAGRFGASPSQSTGACAIYNTGNNATIEVFAGNNTATKRDLLLQTYGGNVGIGTSSPATKLDVNGAVRVNAGASYQWYGGSGSADQKIWDAYSDNTANNPIRFRAVNDAFSNSNTWLQVDRSGFTISSIVFATGSGSERMRIDSSGNVGIGTSSPDQYGRITSSAGATQVSFMSAGSGTAGYPAFGFSGQVTANGGRGAGMYLPADNTICFSTLGAERLRIDGNGNVRIGTAALATTATDGFVYVPTCAGTPTGTPTAITGLAPIVINTTNNKLYFYSGGAWRDAGP